MSLGSERSTVQNLIRYAQEVGWTYLPPEDALRLRHGLEQPFLQDVLIAQLQRLNPGVITTVEEAKEVLSRLERVRPDIEGNQDAWEYLKGLKTVFVQAERRERNLCLLDPKRVEANTFHVTDEFRFRGGPHEIRADVVLLVNGIPVLLLESKAATKPEGIAEALDQVRRYHHEGPELMAQVQVYTVTNLHGFFYGPTWNLTRKALLNWRDEAAGDFETLVKMFLAPSRVVRLLWDYILFLRKDGELTKAVLRPHQMRAVEKVLAQAKDPEKHRGLVWHAQGSGKTYTMITVAKKLLEDPGLQNPTVVMIVDRNELQQQLFQNLREAGFERVEVAASKRHLRELLRRDTRGLIVSMIHKFDDADANLNTRKNIFVLVDEAHRTTGGDLGNYLMGALPNATFIGFTGTPIDKTAHGKGTFKVFGSEDPKGYLDKYSIRDSIKDGTTVPLHYEMAPNDLQVDRETMEQEFWQVAEAEGVSDIEELNRILDRAVTLKNMLKSPERVRKIAAFVAKHFKERILPMGYKAFLVAPDREGCVFYKEALDQLLPPEWSRVVISANHNDPAHLRRYHLREEEEAEVRKAFRKPDADPKILIVTEKLLTGYDAPILYCMYLDKPMRDHVLLQAIARVNRPYEDTAGRGKPNGLIVDFVGILDNLERALAFDSQDVEGVVADIQVLKERFGALMEKARREYLPWLDGLEGDKQAEAILLRLRDKEARDAFYRFFRELEELYEILSPDPFLRPYLEDYETLVRMYHLLRSAYEPHIPVDRSFLRKTAEIVQGNVDVDGVGQPPTTYELGVETLEALLRTSKPDVVKVFNLLREVQRLVEDYKRESAFLISIGERAEALRQAFEARQKETQEILQELAQLIQRLKEAPEEARRSGLSQRAFALAWWAETQKGLPQAKARALAKEVEALLERYPHWASAPRQESDLRSELYRVLGDRPPKERVVWVGELLDFLRRVQDAG
jgi:type I restriction enzyme R subunit